MNFDRYDALIFDCDGTLADTMPAHFRVWRETLQLHGMDFDEDHFYSLGGVSAVKIVGLLADQHGVEVDHVAVAGAKERAFAERGLTGVQPIEPVIAIARKYRGVKPMAVATGGVRAVCEKTLEALEITDWFDAVVTCEDVEHPKPAADTYLLAAEKLGVDPTRCVAFEDADPGVASAKAAGMAVVDVRTM